MTSWVSTSTVGPFHALSALMPNRLLPGQRAPHPDSSAACANVKEAGIPVARWQACAGPTIRARKALGGMVFPLQLLGRICWQVELRGEHRLELEQGAGTHVRTDADQGVLQRRRRADRVAQV